MKESTTTDSNLINPNTYKVFLCTCPANLPFSFAVHPWFVVNHLGNVSRWEVLFSKRKHAVNFGHLHKDTFPTFSGIEIVPLINTHLWNGKILNTIEGDENSLAATMVTHIENSHNTYPYTEHYSLFSKNSNTYVQWVLNHFPEANMNLPWNAFGKNST